MQSKTDLQRRLNNVRREITDTTALINGLNEQLAEVKEAQRTLVQIQGWTDDDRCALNILECCNCQCWKGSTQGRCENSHSHSVDLARNYSVKQDWLMEDLVAAEARFSSELQQQTSHLGVLNNTRQQLIISISKL